MAKQPSDTGGAAAPVKREARKNRVLVAQMHAGGDRPRLIVITNLSSQGARCRAVVAPDPGAYVDIMLDSFGIFRANVRWREGSHFGVAFDTPVDLIAIMLSRTGFRTSDYDAPLTPEFEAVLMSELFRCGEFS